jgi:hypothetical protein
MYPFRDSFYELTIAKTQKQKKFVDRVTEDANIIMGIPTFESSHDLENVYESLVEVNGGDTVDFDAPLPIVGTTSELGKTKLSKIGGRIQIGQDKAKLYGGFDQYIEERIPTISRDTMSQLEKSVVYNNIRSSIISAGKHVSVGGSSNTNYSILAVNWSEGENMAISAKGNFSKKLMFDITVLANGGLTSFIPSGKSESIVGYEAIFAMYWGIQIANSKKIAGLVNIDIENDKLPTALQISEMIEDARLNGSSSALYMHPKLKIHIANKLKIEKMQFRVGDRDFDSLIDSIDGIPIITSRNFLNGTEPNV